VVLTPLRFVLPRNVFEENEGVAFYPNQALAILDVHSLHTENSMTQESGCYISHRKSHALQMSMYMLIFVLNEVLLQGFQNTS
jgi:hypothetical protein